MSDAPAGIGHNQGPPLAEMLAAEHGGLEAEVAQIGDRIKKFPETIRSDDQHVQAGLIVKDARTLYQSIERLRTDLKQPYLDAERTIDGFFKALTEPLASYGKNMQRRGDEWTQKKAAEERQRRETAEREAAAEAARQRQLAAEAEEKNRLATAATHHGRAEIAEDRAAEAAAAARASTADLTRTRSAGVTASARETVAFEITDAEHVDLIALRPYIKAAAIEAAVREFVRINEDKKPLAGVRIYRTAKAIYR